MEQEFTFELKGKGKDPTVALNKLSTLGNEFDELGLDTKAKPVREYGNEIIKSVLEDQHSLKFNYKESSFGKQEGTDAYKRVTGYTFRIDGRGPNIHYNSEDCEDYLVINKMDCGIKDVGGFWPASTRDSVEVEIINKMLHKYRILAGKDFDINTAQKNNLFSDDNVTELSDIPNTINTIDLDFLSILLHYYLQDQFNFRTHVHYYAYTGFISTSTWPGFFLPGGFHKVLALDWVYAMYVEGGIQYNGVGEYEVAVPGGVPWEDIVGFINKKEKKVYMRKGFESFDKQAYDKIYGILTSIINESPKPKPRKNKNKS
ncbi:unnamed protein product [Diamesa hyperborea]